MCLLAFEEGEVRGWAQAWETLFLGRFQGGGLEPLVENVPGRVTSHPVLPADGADPSSGQLPGVSVVEDPAQRLRWQAHLEFTHNHDVGDLTWDKIAVSLPCSEKLRSLVLAGIPHSMRPQVRPHAPGCVPTFHETLRFLPPPRSCGCGSRGPCRRRKTRSCPTERL